MRAHTLLLILVLIGALALGVVLLPQIASAWLLNLANASLARAQSLPADSPRRLDALDEAAANVTRAQEIASGPRLLLAQARVLILRGDDSRALSTFESAGVAPSDTIGQFLWGESAYESNRADIAFAHWRAAGAVEFFIQEAHRAQDAHQWQTAERMARIAVGIEPARAEAHYVLGDALGWLSSADPVALSELDQALALTNDPEFISTILSRKGELLADRGRYDQALDLFKQARAVAPIDARPRTDYAMTLLRASPEAHQEAEALLKQVIDDSPWYSAAYVALADIASSEGKLKEAEAWLQTGLASNPNHPGLLMPLAELYVRENRIEPARQALVLAIKNETRADALQEIAHRLERLKAP